MRYVIFLLLTLNTFSSSAQKRSAQKLFSQAQECRNIDDAEKGYKAAIQKDQTYLEAYLALDGIYAYQNRYNEAVHLWKQAATYNNHKHLPIVLARLSKAAYLDGQYLLADSSIQKIPLSNNPVLQHLQACIAFALDAISHPQPFVIKNLGPDLNTSYDDYWPSLSINEKNITTTVLVPGSEAKTYAQEDLYTSAFHEGKWQTCLPLSSKINSAQNEGAQCLSADGKLLFFTACDRNTGIGSCDIYWSRKIHGTWSTPEALPEPINSYYWDAHPSISADNKKLYFSSNRNGGCGGKDLYVANVELTERCIIKSIHHLGNVINTPNDEISPYIHPDNKTLYFSSDGHVGMGKQDIYYTKVNHLYNSEVCNMGYPINTQNDEIGLVINTKGNAAYFATERFDSRKKDIYTFETPVEARPEAISYLSATIIDANTQRPLEADIKLSLLEDLSFIVKQENATELTTILRGKGKYILQVTHSHYIYSTDTFTLDQNNPQSIERVIALTPIQPGEHFVIPNILFRYDSYEIEEKYHNELNQMALMISKNPQHHFEITGHTDDKGSESYNKRLSSERAKTIYEYLINRGIPETQLSYKGYGNSAPISEDPSKNRRIELIIQ